MNQIQIPRLMAVACLALVCACFHAEVEVQTAIAVPGSLPDENLTPMKIRAYRSSAPDRPYREIGVVYVRASDPTDLDAGWREAAAALGGDALIDVQVLPTFGLLATVIAWTEEEEP